jgi:cysteine desulfuration protein SufE
LVQRGQGLGVTHLDTKLADLVATFAVLTDSQERMALAADWGRRMKPLPPSERLDVHRVRGCVSPVWLVGELLDGRCFFRAEAESPVVRGLLALLCEFYAGVSPREIAACTIDPLERLELLRNLSPTRRNGLASARACIQAFARGHAESEKES